MNSFSEIIDAFHGEFAQAAGIEESHARTMKARDSIPGPYRLRVAQAAKERSLEGITLERMAELDSTKLKHREGAQ